MQIRELIRSLSKSGDIENCSIIECTIISIDSENLTCIADSLNGKFKNLECRIMIDISDGDLEIPELDSNVLVVMSENMTPVILKSTWLLRKLIAVDNQSYEIKKDLQKFNNGIYGGIPVIEDSSSEKLGILKRLNSIEDKINELCDFAKNHTHLGNYAVSGAAASGTSNPVLPSFFVLKIDKTKKKDIENENIIHGNNGY